MPRRQSSHSDDERRARRDGASASAPAGRPARIVAVGASPGGLGAVARFLAPLPPHTGASFVVVQHVDADEPAIAAEALSRHSSLPVCCVEGGADVEIEPDHVYLVSPDAAPTLADGRLHVGPSGDPPGHGAPIDRFFASLAASRGERAIAVLLSGGCSDGAAGVRAVAEQGGLTIAEDPATAAVDTMPRGAIDTGAVDLVLPVEAMPAAVLRRVRDGDAAAEQPRAGLDGASSVEMTELKRAHALASQARREAEARAAQQATVAEIGTYALQERDVQKVLERAVDLVCDTLHAEFAKVLQLAPDGESLLLRCGRGWPPDLVGRATVSAGDDSQAGHTLRARQPIIVEDLRTERRFRGPPLLVDHGAISGMSVVVEGIDRPWGVLGVHTRRPRRFDERDIAFVQAIANVLAIALRARAFDDALAASEERLRMALSAANVGTWRWVVDDDRDTRDANLNRLLGLDPVESIQPIDDLLRRVHADDRERVARDVGAAVRARGDFECEYRVIRPDGSIRWLSDRGRVIAEAGAAAYMTGVVVDVTEAREAQEAAQAADRRIRSLLESIRDGFLAIDRDWRFSFVNPAAAELLDASPERLLGRDVFAVFPAIARPTMRAELRRAAEERTAVHFEEFFPARVAWYEYHAYPTAEGLSVLFREVTARKRAELALMESEQRLELAVGSGDGFWDIRFDPADPYRLPDEIYLSPGQKRLAGYEPDELASSRSAWALLMAPEDREAHRSAAEAFLRDGGARFDFQYRLRHRDGRWLWIQSRGNLVRARDGTPLRWTGIDWDITAHKRAEELRLRLASIVEHSRDAIIGIDLDGTITSWNRAAAEIYGFGEAEAVGMPLAVIVPDDRRDELTQILARLRRGEPTEHLETVRLTRSGRWVEVAITHSPIRDGKGSVVGASAIHRDISPQKAAERALGLSETRYRTLVETMSSFVWTTDERGAFVEPQPSWAAYTGQPWPDHGGCGWLAMIHADDRERLLREWSHHLETMEPYRVEGRLWHAASGDYHYFVARAAPIRAPDGVVREWIGNVVDVDARRRAELAAQESERRFVAVADAAPVMIWMAGPDGGCTYCNRGWLEFTGRTLEQQLGVGWTEGVHPDDRERVLRTYAAAFERRAPLRVEYRLRRADGEHRWILDHGVPRFGRDAELVGYVGSCVDVHDLKEAEAALHEQERLRESETRLREVADALPQMVWSAAPDGAADYFNQRWHHNTGMSAADSRGDGWRAAVHPDDRPALADRWQRALADGEAVELELRVMLPARGWTWHVARLQPLRDGKGRLTRWLATFLDVHEQRAAEAELREADRRKNEFLALLAHELRNPLAPILSSVEVLRRPGVADEQAQRHRDVIERQARHMARLLDDLLDISRITHGRIELRTRVVDLRAIVEEVLTAVRPQIPAGGHRLRVALAAAPLRVLADPARIHQVVGNLVNNAIKYTEPGGEIAVSVERADGEAVVRVRDTGIGVPPDMLPRIFEVFTQVETARNLARGGLGIGLSLVKRLVELHGGRVEAHSAGLHRGSEFVVRLPLARDDDVEAAAPAAAAEPPAAPSRQILVVDDNVDAADTMSDLLTCLGHTTRVAYDGAAALAIAREFRPEVVLLDLRMPDMDGYEVARSLRATAESNDAFIVALTGFGQQADRATSRAAGFDAHLTKPVVPEVLEELLAGSLAGAAPADRR